MREGRKKTGLFTGHGFQNLAGRVGLGPYVLKSHGSGRVESGRVKRFQNLAGRVGSGRVGSGRVGSGQ